MHNSAPKPETWGASCSQGPWPAGPTGSSSSTGQTEFIPIYQSQICICAVSLSLPRPRLSLGLGCRPLGFSRPASFAALQILHLHQQPELRDGCQRVITHCGISPDSSNPERVWVFAAYTTMLCALSFCLGPGEVSQSRAAW